MDLRKARLKMINAFPGGWDAIAPALGFTRQALENRVYERKGQSMHTHLDIQLQEFSGTTFFAEAVATASRGTFVKLPTLDHDVCHDSLATKFRELYAELGELSAKFNDYTRDDELNERECADLSNIRDQIHKTMEELMALTFIVYRKDHSPIGKPPAD